MDVIQTLLQIAIGMAAFTYLALVVSGKRFWPWTYVAGSLLAAELLVFLEPQLIDYLRFCFGAKPTWEEVQAGVTQTSLGWMLVVKFISSVVGFFGGLWCYENFGR